MRWLRSLFAEPEEEVCQTPVLGQLRRRGDSDWEGTKAFPGPEDEVLVFVPARPGSPPPAAADALWLEIERRYPALEQGLLRAVADHAELGPETSFELGSISLDADCSWEAQFAPVPESGDMGYFVSVVDWEVRDVSAAD